MWKPIRQLVGGVLIGLAVVLGGTAPASAGWIITQITDNSTTDYIPAISGSNVVWAGSDGDFEIYLWNGATTTQITTNSTDDLCPAISGSNVVWHGCDGGTGSECSGGDLEIYLWNGATTTQITNDSTSDADPDISGSNVAWEGHDGDWEIYMAHPGVRVPALSTPAVTLLTGLLMGTALWLIRGRHVASA